jgi:opacity protein-like surface antigen
MTSKIAIRFISPIGLATLSLYLPYSASAENVFSIYTGTSFTRESALHLTQPGTALSLDKVEWDADPFKAAPYYGLRLTHFYDQYPRWGVALDFTHYKMYAKTERIVQVEGAWKGTPVSGPSPMKQYVQQFEISHGVNVLSLNGIYRWSDSTMWGTRLQPYIGAGLAYYRPHSESIVDNLPHASGYDASGFGYQLLAGARYQFTQRIGAFVEAKFNRGTAEVSIAGGRAETPLRTFHAIAGLSYSF